MVVWKKIQGYNYLIGSNGEVKALRTSKILTPYLCNGYLKVDLYVNSSRKKIYVHQLIGNYFLSKSKFAGSVINHKDGNRKNNDILNLEWCTRSYNNKHSYDVLGRVCIKPKGKDSWNAKSIIQIAKDGTMVKEYGSIADAIKEFGCGVEKVLYGRDKTAYGFIWRHKIA